MNKYEKGQEIDNTIEYLIICVHDRYKCRIQIGYDDTLLDYDQVIELRDILDVISTQLKKKYSFEGKKYTKEELAELKDKITSILGETNE